MIYIDTSVMLAQLFYEQRLPPASFWQSPLVPSELLEYELMVRVHARGLSPEPALSALARVNIVPFHSAAPCSHFH
jgi:hypothetical protein